MVLCDKRRCTPRQVVRQHIRDGFAHIQLNYGIFFGVEPTDGPRTQPSRSIVSSWDMEALTIWGTRPASQIWESNCWPFLGGGAPSVHYLSTFGHNFFNTCSTLPVKRSCSRSRRSEGWRSSPFLDSMGMRSIGARPNGAKRVALSVPEKIHQTSTTLMNRFVTLNKRQ